MSQSERNRSRSLELSFVVAALVARRNDLVRESIETLRAQGVSREAVREMILQSYLHDGYATALEGMTFLAEVWPGDPDPVDDPNCDNYKVWRDRGEKLFREVYGDVADRARSNIAEISPELAEWMVVEGYGKVLSRGILDTPTRELGTVAVLIMKRRSKQLFSHLRGALRVGVSLDELNLLLDRIAAELNATDAAREARELLDQVA
ncbi:MAG: carboxymuconolactone decarboxylase family protein [bacterium]